MVLFAAVFLTIRYRYTIFLKPNISIYSRFFSLLENNMKAFQTKFLYAMLCACLMITLAGASPAFAAAVVVNSNLDTQGTCATSGTGTCTLRDAITYANSTPGADTITFDANYTITLSGSLPSVTSVITITGNGAANTKIDGNSLYRVFAVDTGGDLRLNNLTVQNGRCNGGSSCSEGAGIYNAATLTINNTTISGNAASSKGAGIYNSGTLAVTNSTFANNTLGLAGDGGGIYNNTGSTTIANCTFSSNTANNGGGVYNNTGATLNVTNCTFSANIGNVNGGGIYNIGTLNLKNSILANSSGGRDCYGTVGTANNNLLEGPTEVCGLSTGHIIGQDPKLDVLTSYTGYTQVFPLLSGSPAIDAGNPTVCSALPVSNLDQRGATRPKGTSCDIGAFESDVVVSSSPTITSINRAGSSPTNATSVNFTVTFSAPVTGVDITDFSLNIINDPLNPPGITGASITSVSAGTNTYTVTVNTGTDSGELQLKLLNDNSISDISSNNLAGTFPYSGQSYIIDRVAPRVASITRNSVKETTNAPIVDYTVTFTESVKGVDAADFSVTANGFVGASIASVSGSGTVYTISINTGINSGTLRLDLIDNNSIIDLAGVPLGGWGINNYTCWMLTTLEKSLPTVTSIVKTSKSPTNANSVDFKVTFSEAVTGVDTADFSLAMGTGLSGASVTGVNGKNTEYTVTVSTGAGSGSLHLDFTDNDSITDPIGNKPGGEGVNNGNFINGETYTIDKTAPTATSIIRANTSNPTSAPSVDFIVTFSKKVTGVDITDFSLNAPNLSGASISNVSNSDPFYIVTVNTGTGDDIIRLDLVDNDSILDAVSNPLGGTGAGNGNFNLGETYTIDRNFPAVTGSIRLDANPITAGIVHFNVTFSESVSGVDGSDFLLTTSNITNSVITEVLGSGASYTVAVNTGSGTGTVRLDIVDNDSILNSEGHLLGGAGTGNGNFINGEIYTISEKIFVSSSEKYRSNGDYDGWILELKENSTQGGTKSSTADTFILGDGVQNRQYRSILHFPTSSLPDNAVITNIILMIKAQSLTGTDPFTTHGGINVDIKSGAFGAFGPFSFNSLQLTDFQSASSLNSVGQIQNNPVGMWYWTMLNSSAFPYINLTGSTQLRLAFQLDDNNDGGNDYLKFYSGDSVDQGNRPYLLIEYLVPKY